MKLEFEDLDKRYLLLPAQLLNVEDGAVIRRGTTQLRVSGDDAFAIVEHVAALTSRPGGATVDEVCDAFALEQGDALRALVEKLIARRLLIDAVVPETPPDDSARFEDGVEVFLWQSSADAGSVRKTLAERRVAVVGVNEISLRLVPALRGLGYRRVELLDHPMLRNAQARSADDGAAALGYDAWADGEADVDLLVATSDFGGLAAMREWNAECVERDVTFLPVVLQDLIGYAGPIVVPRVTPCFECFWLRQSSHLDAAARGREAEVGAFFGQSVDARLRPMAAVLGEIAALEIFKHDARIGGISSPVGRVVEVALLEPELTARKVLRLPRCPVCGPLTKAAARSPERDVFMPGHGE